MRLNTFKINYLILLVILLFSCNTDEEQTLFSSFIIDENSDLRGLTIGSSTEEVKLKELAKPITEEADYLYYIYSLGELGQYSVSYTFDKDGLFELNLLIELTNGDQSLEMYDKLKYYLLNKYGASKTEEKGNVIWIIRGETSQEIEVSLLDESENMSKSRLSLTFYDYDY